MQFMQRFSMSLLMGMICVNAMADAYLPVVDVANGSISARRAFGEEIIQQKNTVAEPVKRKVEKKVVARTAKPVANESARIAVKSNGDVLKPRRPSSDLWARNDTPLRMPRIDEFSVVSSDALLPEENIDVKPVQVAKNDNDTRVTRQEMMEEMNFLRSEIARLATIQEQQQPEKIVQNTPSVVKRQAVEPVVEKNVAGNNNDVNVRREIVSIESSKDVAARSGIKAPAEPRFAAVSEMSKLTPSELKKAFKKTYLSENKHLSTYPVDERYDVVSDMAIAAEGFTAESDLSEISAGVRPLEIKISFLNGDSGLSRENYNLLSESAAIVVNNPKRAIQVAIPESATKSKDSRKLAARRLAIVEQVLRDTGVAEQRIVPVLSQRDDDAFVLRVISGEMFETLTQQKRNLDNGRVSKKTYKSMTW